MAAVGTPWEPLTNPDDPDSLRLLAAFLEEDLRAAENAHAAQALQLELVLGDSRPGPPQALYSSSGTDEAESDELLSLRRQLDLVNSTLSKVSIARLAGLQSSVVADSVRARQLDEQYQAAKRREAMDFEFARALQHEDDEGRDSDAAAMQGVERLLGERKVTEIMTSSAAGKERETVLPPPPYEDTEMRSTAVETLPECALCFDRTQPVSDPYAASLAPSSSRDVPFGMYLGCQEDGHVSCVDCLGTYLQKKLEGLERKAFPILCPQCPYELTDEDAARILGLDNLEAWHYRKLLDSLPPLFCPNARCSARILPHANADEQPQAQCPSCRQLACAPCKSMWRNGYTCEQYQALPPRERDPEDFAFFELARREKWTRCPGCQSVIELSTGCRHMTCSRCGVEHCYNCGSLWEKVPGNRYGECSNNPPCELWDPEQLLMPEYRNRAPPEPVFAAPRIHVPIARVVPPPAPAPAPVPYWDDSDSDDDMLYHRPLVDSAGDQRMERMEQLRFVLDDYRPGMYRHAFTAIFLEDLECGYCQRVFGSRQALRQHLADAPHDVYSCCGRLYRAYPHLQQHIETGGGHHDPLIREP
ncbi:hypothetical protein JCM21900_005936 [Sporobolomyces salmonicolor]